MPAKKRSFDIGPEPKRAAQASPRRAPARRKRRASAARTTKPAVPRRETLRERRERARARAFWAIIGVAVIIGGLVVYGLWRPEVRIAEVTAEGARDPDALAQLAKETMDGSYYHVVPRDSFLFYPERAIKDRILRAYPSIESVKISRTNLTTIALAVETRASAFLWCGSPDVPLGEGSCYDADENGYIFARVSFDAASSTQLRVRAFVDTASSTDGTPIRGKVMGSGYVPDVLEFIDTIQALGVLVDSVSIRGDEADLFTREGARITYVIGEEKHAEKDARAAFPGLNFNNGSVEYVDLRFAGKVYVKRAGALAKESE